jgi:3-hydroxyacyl-[acyl-carrier-protein] dehydratase
MQEVNFPIIDKNFVEQLIPQKHPIVMVDSLLNYNETEIIAGLTINNSNIFIENNCLNESGIVEHMAQTVALYTGYQYYLKNEKPPTGYIGSIKKIEIFQLPKSNVVIKSRATIIQEFMGVTLVDIETYENEKLIAKGQMKTVIAN